MGLFERLGEKVERVKQQVDTAKAESADYRCRSCEARIYSDLDACPECGSEDVARVAPSTEKSGESPGEGASGEPAESGGEPPDEDVDGPLIDDAEGATNEDATEAVPDNRSATDPADSSAEE